MQEATFSKAKVEASDIDRAPDGSIFSARYTLQQPDGSRWSVRYYAKGNSITREPDGRRVFHTPSIGRAYRDVAGDSTVHWNELTT